jgi:hypothetical protein
MRIFFIIPLLLLSAALVSQRFTLEFETGLGSYTMSELSQNIHHSAQHNILNPQVVSDFPPFVYYRPGLGFKTNNHHLGFSLGFYSTGARSAVRDYSGSYHSDMVLRGTAPMFFEEMKIWGTKKLAIALRANIGMIFSTIGINEQLTLYDKVEYDESVEYVSLQVFVVPELKCNYRLSESTEAVFGLGYHLGITAAPVSVQPDSWFDYLKYAERRYTETSWDGLRVSLGIQYRI